MTTTPRLWLGTVTDPGWEPRHDVLVWGEDGVFYDIQGGRWRHASHVTDLVPAVVVPEATTGDARVRREALIEEVADELRGWPIGSGYYALTVGAEARDMAEAVIPVVERAVAGRAVRVDVAPTTDAPDLEVRGDATSDPAADAATLDDVLHLCDQADNGGADADAWMPVHDVRVAIAARGAR